MDEWQKAEDDEEEEESDEPLENIIEESETSTLPRTLSQAIIPSLETTPEQFSEVRFRRVRTQEDEEQTPNPDYALNSDYTSDNAYQASEPIEPVAPTLQPTSIDQSQQTQSAPGYPGQKTQTKNYESNLEQQAKKQREERRRF